MPGTPSRRVFGLFNVYRFILAILIAWVVMEAPHYCVFRKELTTRFGNILPLNPESHYHRFR